MGRAFASPRRLALLDLLIQGERSVERLSTGVGQPIANTSQHLQVLRRARVVETRRIGTTVLYRLAPGVPEVYVALRRLAQERSADLARSLQTDSEPTIDRLALRRRLTRGDVVLVDVRPHDEFVQGHLPGARSLPLEELEARIPELPDNTLIVATCRGPFCDLALHAVRRIRATGREAVRFEDSVGDWLLDGGLLSSG